MPKISETAVPCGNKYCDNKAARVDVICGNLISSPDEKCDYLNYASPKCVSSLRLIFILPQIPKPVNELFLDGDEICIDIAGLETIKDSQAFFQENYSSEYGEFVSKFFSGLLLSWAATFGIASNLNPDSNHSEPSKFGWLDLTQEGEQFQVGIEINIYLLSHQYDMLEYYSKTIAEDLLDRDDLVWVHEGEEIRLVDIEHD